MPISFADALKKAKPPVKVEPENKDREKIITKNQNILSGESQNQQKQKQHDRLRSQRQQNKSDGNKRPPSHQTSNKKSKSKKPKPSAGVSLGDVLKLPSRSQPTVIEKNQTTPDLINDFPSLGYFTGTKSESTPSWGKSRPKAKAPKPAPSIGRKKERLKEKKAVRKTAAVKKEDAAVSETKSLLAAFGAKQRSVEEETQMGTFLKNPSTVQKGRQRLGPRKKRFSTLKKKVLQERLVQWEAKISENQTDLKGDSDASSTIALWNFCLPEETEDDEELDEILSNLKEMASKVGPFEELFIDKDSGHAYCLFASVDTARAAEACWNDLVLGGTKLQVELLSGEQGKGSEGVESWKEWISNYTRWDPKDNTSLSVVVLENILSEEDIEDEECMAESLKDIQSIASSLGILEKIQVEKSNLILLSYRGQSGGQSAVRYFNGTVIGGQVVSAHLRQDMSSSVILTNVLTEEDFEDNDCLYESLSDLRELAAGYGIVQDVQVYKREKYSVVVEYEGNIGKQTLLDMNSQIIGGQQICATLLHEESNRTQTIMLKNFLTEDDLEDEDCLEETKADIADLAKRFGTVVRIDLHVESRQVKITYKSDANAVDEAISGFNKMVIGGKTVVAVKESAVINELSLVQDEVETNNIKEVSLSTDPKPMYSGDKLISERFAECKRVPKIPNTGTRKYATLIEDESVKSLLQEMLGELMRLQKRAAEDKNAKARRRLVMGLREVARGIRAHKVKLVVMANNLDEYGVIDEKLQEIIDLAREENVPIFYEFNKRKLGKAIGKSIKIGVIGVQNADGAYQEFKKLISLANKYGAR